MTERIPQRNAIIARGRTAAIGLAVSVVVALGAAGRIGGAAAASELPPEQVEFFEKHIRPILAQECYECHNSRDEAKAGLVLDHREGWRAGGDSGPVIAPGRPAESLLLGAIRHERDDLQMPKSGAKLDEHVIDDFRRWIAMGAPDPRDGPPSEEQLAEDTSWEAIRDRRAGWWSFQPIARPDVPEVEGVDHPVDRFVRARLAEEGLTPSGPADPRTLVRRLHFTLVGLPPEPEEAESFVAAWKADPDAAVAAEVDRLMGSPQFGEKWARHWMDWTRYADSHGSEGDPDIPKAWRYRDYLIRAWNDDVPYDQLVLEHFAGDLVDAPRIDRERGINESALGTGHLRMVYHGFAPTDALEERVRFTDDQIDAVTKAFMGLTVSCARCHDHKFDAISQADYYALFGIFTSALPATVSVDAPGVAEKNRDSLASLKPEIRRAMADAWLAALEDGRLDWEGALEKAGKNGKDGTLDPVLQPLRAVRRAGEGSGEAAAAWRAQRKAFRDAMAKAESARSGDAIRRHWDLSDPAELADWTRDGVGVEDTEPAPAGEFALAPGAPDADDGPVIDAILPAGMHSHRLSTRHRGVLASAPLELDGEYDLHLHAAGDGGLARYAVQHYPRRGTVYPVTRLEKGDWHRIRYGRLDYWKGDRIHLEFTTAADTAVLTRDRERSWFGVREAILVEKGAPVPLWPEKESQAPLFAGQDAAPADFDQAVDRYRETLRRVLAQWRRDDGSLDDAPALFLDGLLQSGVLPNRPGDLPGEGRELVRRYRELESQVPAPTRAPGVLERPGRDQPLYVRGDHEKPGDPVPRRFLEAIDETPYATDGTGRLPFARDLLSEDNPFTARVIVNRVWHHLFGGGLVSTMDNFGRLGDKPSHPELLDFLAARFREDQGWSLKALIRDLVLTETWRQEAIPSDEATRADPDNRLLSHFSIRRPPAEGLRDAILAVSGELENERYGPPVTGNAPRRSVYLKVKRNRLDPFLKTFDFPTPASAVGRRDRTNVPAQSLTLLNDPFLRNRAADWAGAMLDSLPADAGEDARIRRLFETALSRPPTETELAKSRSFLQTVDGAARANRERIRELEKELASVREQRRELLEPVRRRLLAERGAEDAGTGVGLPPSAAPSPVAQWDFEGDLADSAGNLSGAAKGDARLDDGALVVDGNGFVATGPLPFELGEKTLAATVRLSDLDQRGGGVITVQDRQGRVFDSLVFGERRPRRWLAGSNGFARTLDFEAPDETEAADRPVHLALVYEGDGTIRCYREGEPWGDPVRKAPLHTYAAGEAEVLFGLRHGKSPHGNLPLRGRILEASLYDRALSPDEVRAVAAGRALPAREVEAALTETQRTEKAALEARIAELRSARADRRQPDAELPPHRRRWRELTHALFNLKEFVYLK